jgi:hypothetical protein
MRGMRNARPDIGVVSVQRTSWKEKEIVWLNLFAVNDRESTMISVDLLKPYYKPDATRIGILNNRYDRADRALRFATIAAKDLDMDYWITFGAYESQVTERMIELGMPAEKIIQLGFSKNPTLEEIFDVISSHTVGEQCALIGLVNIHTPQAELLLDYFNRQPDAPIHINPQAAREHYRPRIEQVKERLIGSLARKGTPNA